MPKLEQAHSTPRSGGGRRARHGRVSSQLSEINVVPLIDVMLVLLVIFMVAAPMMQQGFPVDLPEARTARPIEQQPLIVSIPAGFAQSRQVYFGEEAVEEQFIAERARQIMAENAQKNVTLASDGAVLVRDYISVMDRLKAGGVTKVDVQTQPPRTGRQP